jgi:hypothetical protein
MTDDPILLFVLGAPYPLSFLNFWVLFVFFCFCLFLFLLLPGRRGLAGGRHGPFAATPRDHVRAAAGPAPLGGFPAHVFGRNYPPAPCLVPHFGREKKNIKE